ncbi:MAG: sensor histidine kinase [Crocinitomicaceae bacterium]|nr:sensor histidine kinase [Crocinitomicaceae bacterium]
MTKNITTNIDNATRTNDENSDVSQRHYKSLFDDCPVPIWDEDFSKIKEYIEDLKSQGITDIQTHFEAHPGVLLECASLLIVNDINQAVIDLNQATSKEHLLNHFTELINENSPRYVIDQFVAIANNESSCEFDAELITFNEVKRHVHLKWTVVKGFEHNYAKVYLTTTDVTKRIIAENLLLQHSNKEKELLLKEIHHRVKNNLQIVTSLLNLQANSIDDQKTKSLFEVSLHRINSMALVHELLYQSKDFSQINYGSYLKQLVHPLIDSMHPEGSGVSLNIEADEISLNINTSIPLGLLINEIITNSLKHGFNVNQTGEIYLRLHDDGESNFRLCIGDNGNGYDNDFNIEDADSLGLQLIHSLTEQLSGTINRDCSLTGTNYCVKFKELPSNSQRFPAK